MPQESTSKIFELPSDKCLYKKTVFFTTGQFEANNYPYTIIAHADKEMVQPWHYGFSLTKEEEFLKQCFKRGLREREYFFTSLVYEYGDSIDVSNVLTFAEFKEKRVYSRLKILCPHCFHFSFIGDCLSPKEEEKATINKLVETFGEKYWKAICYKLSNITLTLDVGEPKVLGLPNVFEDGKAICPCCSRDLSVELFGNANKERILTNLNTDTYYENATVFEDKEKLVLSQYFRSYGVNNSQTKAFLKHFRVRYTLKTDSGMSYIPIVKGGGDSFPKHMFNLTFGNPHVQGYSIEDRAAVLHIFKALAKRKCPSKELQDDWLKGAEDNLRLVPATFLMQITCILNRLPCLTFQQAWDIAKMPIYDVTRSRFLGKTKHTDNYNTVINQILKNCGVKNCKSTKKLLSQNFNLLVGFWLFSHLGFKDINLIKRFVDTLGNRSGMSFSNYMWGYKNASILIKKLIALKGEPAIIKLIEQDSSQEFMDVARMYCRIMEQDPSMIKEDYLRKSVSEMHAILIDISNQLKYKNMPIPLIESENVFDQDIMDLEFRRAKDTHELISVGQLMRICVGGYRDEVISRYSIIVVARERDKPVICIELRQDGKKYRLAQAKSFGNQKVQGYHAIALKQWIKNVGSIETEQCSDYKHIIDNQIDKETASQDGGLDYHQLELVENNVIF